MIKKPILCFILGGALLLPTTGAFAVNSEVPAIVEDKEKKPSKSFEPVPLNTDGRVALAASSPHWSATSGMYALGGVWTKSNSYTDSSKSTRRAIDRIYAKTRHYVSGGLNASKTDDNANSSIAGAEVNKGTLIAGDNEVYGTHKFEEAGYQSWYPETYDT